MASTYESLTKVRECLAGVKQIAALPLSQVAAREAHHATEAYIFEASARPSKPIASCEQRSVGWRAARPRIAPESLTFLARAYELISISDYGVGPTTRAISGADATAAIDTAERFIDTITQLVPPGLTPPRGPSAQP